MTDAGGLEFHHVGVACIDIRAEADRMASLGYRPEGVEFSDVRQGVRGLFLGGQSPRLELLQPLDGAGAGVLTPWLKNDVKMYHIGYKTSALIDAIERVRACGGKLVVPPVAAVAFGGREIAFVMLPNRLLIELIAE
jgi:methylmalonyl-CoA/ethylmalonyl-CoA epimerase